MHELVGVRTSVMMQGACLLLQNVCLYPSFWKSVAADAALYESRNSHVCCHGSGLLIVDGNDRRETKMIWIKEEGWAGEQERSPVCAPPPPVWVVWFGLH